MGMKGKDEKVIKSGTEFMTILGFVFIALGIIGSMALMMSFDWETYNELKGYSFSNEEELNILKPQMINTIVISGAILLVNVAIGAFFIAIDKIAWTLKKIQLGMTD